MTPSIRPLTPEDIPAVARVHIASWQTAYRGILPDAFLDRMMDGLPRRIARWEEGMRNPESPGVANFVVELPGAGIAGFVGGGAVRDGRAGFTGELFAIYLLAEHRRHGLGRLLFRRCVEHLRDLGHGSMMLWVLEANRGSRAFYAAMGGAVIPGAVKELTIAGGTHLEIAYGWERLPEGAGPELG